ncbi:unnamed protein product [Moneuplotes crassus]|uniref:histidine kinase n=1 Tax=Euplotes crassus TaxID=5936 RepID=A0AAD1Y6Y5_EUPCR|nr:unnamed protein product [Moneuplotes crassus]
MFEKRPSHCIKNAVANPDNLDNIENFIMEMQVKSFKNKFFKRIKLLCIAFALVMILMGISIHFFMEDAADSEIGRNRCIISGFMLIFCVGILQYYPEKHGIISPVFLVWTFICLSDIYKTSDRHVVHEYALPCIGYAYLTLVLIPSTWEANLIAWMLGFGYNISTIYEKRGEVPTTFWIAMLPAMFYYITTSYLQNCKLKELYEHLRDNEVLRNEMTNILETFPNGVLIHPCNLNPEDTRSPFTNHEFNEKVLKINKQLDEIEKVEVMFDQDHRGSRQKVKCDLLTYLTEVHQRLQSREVFEQHTIKLLNSEKGRNSSEALDEDIDQVYTIKCIKVEWASMPCFMNVFIDNTDIVRLEKANNNIKYQKMMFASASHEFRTPLNAIMNSYGFLQQIHEQVFTLVSSLGSLSRDFVMELDFFSEQISKYLKMGSASSSLLMSLIEDILDLSKMEAGTFSINMGNFKLCELINEVHEIFSLQTSQKGILLIAKVDDILKDVMIRSDKGRIKQVLLNLVSNSLKFTFEGSIVISVKAKRKSRGNFVVFEVTDTGVGIKKSEQKKLFKLFGMADSDKNMNPNGCGIGLTISKKYIEKLGGSIKLSSVYKKGTTTKFTIPISSDIFIKLNRKMQNGESQNLVEKVDYQTFCNSPDGKEDSKCDKIQNLKARDDNRQNRNNLEMSALDEDNLNTTEDLYNSSEDRILLYQYSWSKIKVLTDLNETTERGWSKIDK